MKVKTVDEAMALVGRTFERGGQSRTITRIEQLRETCGRVFGFVYWKRPGGKERVQPKWLPYFNEWLSKAQETSDA